MKRRLVTVIVFVLLLGGGAIVNIAVAAGIAAWMPMQTIPQQATRPHPWSMTPPEDSWPDVAFTSVKWEGNRVVRSIEHVSVDTAASIANRRQQALANLGRKEIEYRDANIRAQFEVHDLSRTVEGNNPRGLYVMQPIIAGWPALAFVGAMCERATGQPTPDTQMSWAVSCPVNPLTGSYARPRIIPLCPVWPGFAINTVFYAGVLWLLFAAPFALRRRSRIKRGLCPKCAYPVGENAVCSECGAAVKPRPAGAS